MPGKINHHALEPSVRIGKEGITENVVKLVITLLKRRKVIKVKFLPTAITSDKKVLVKELAERAHARVIHQVGFIAVLEKVK